jgi:hypothetical protein
MLTVCYSVKGGQGCTTVAAGLAVASRPVTVVDATGDVPAVLGVPEPAEPGLLDLVSLSAAPVSADDLRSVAVDAGYAGVVPRGGSLDLVPGERWRVLGEALVRDNGAWVLDAGTGPAWEAAAVRCARSVLVIRNCYLALRRPMAAPVRPSAVVLVEEPGRALGRRDVRAVLNGLPLVSVPVDPAVARAVQCDQERVEQQCQDEGRFDQIGQQPPGHSRDHRSLEGCIRPATLGGAPGMIVSATRLLKRSQARRATSVTSNAPRACWTGSDTFGLSRVVGHRTPVRVIGEPQPARPALWRPR